MPRTIDLGLNTFSAPKSKQCLLSKASATFLLPKEPAVLPTDLEQILDSRSIWIVKGRDLTLDIYIEGPCDGLGAMFTFLNHSVDLLKEAKLWSDLGLVASTKSYECKPNSDHTMTLRLSLTVQEDFKRIIKEIHGKVPRSIRRRIFVDPQPPPGIATVELSNIQIFLGYHSSTSKCVTHIDSFGMNESLEDSSMAASDDVERPESDNRSPTPWSGFPASTPSTSSPSYSPFTPELHPSGTEAVFRHPPVGVSVIKANAVAGGDDCQLHRLLDCAIRNWISSNPSKVAHGIEQLNPRGALKLSDIAPSVFSPGYHDSIRQRAGFIPVVAKSIASIVNKSASEDIRQKVSSLKSHFEENYEGTPTHSPPSEALDLRSMVKCLLWTSLQKGVYDPKAARKLSPITLAGSRREDDSSMLEDQFSLPYSDDALSMSLDIESDYADTNADEVYDDDDDNDYNRTLFEEELCFPFSDSGSDSDDLIDAVCRFSVSGNEEEESTEELLPEQPYKQENDEPSRPPPMMDSVEEFGAMSSPPTITGYARKRGRSFSDRTTHGVSEQPYGSAVACQYERSSSAGFQSSPLTLNEEMLSPRMKPENENEIEIEIETASDFGSLASFEEEEEEDYLLEEESLLGNESFNVDDDEDVEMLY
ncbi:hypothetical protein VTN77DRAFT_1171 [Rasamsonia byssochlamydoides]|uniref:uncharacterized protein n=1 Tax=Rasamsonia byssochlamydoides TaxID=89139 RepID=UPI0037440234